MNESGQLYNYTMETRVEEYSNVIADHNVSIIQRDKTWFIWCCQGLRWGTVLDFGHFEEDVAKLEKVQKRV